MIRRCTCTFSSIDLTSLESGPQVHMAMLSLIAKLLTSSDLHRHHVEKYF